MGLELFKDGHWTAKISKVLGKIRLCYVAFLSFVLCERRWLLNLHFFLLLWLKYVFVVAVVSDAEKRFWDQCESQEGSHWTHCHSGYDKTHKLFRTDKQMMFMLILVKQVCNDELHMQGAGNFSISSWDVDATSGLSVRAWLQLRFLIYFETSSFFGCQLNPDQIASWFQVIEFLRITRTFFPAIIRYHFNHSNDYMLRIFETGCYWYKYSICLHHNNFDPAFSGKNSTLITKVKLTKKSRVSSVSCSFSKFWIKYQ